MSFLQINAVGAGATVTGGLGLDRALTQALCAVPADAPVVVLIHGFRFSPTRARSDPHRHILAMTPPAGVRRAVSWPRHLGFGRGNPLEGLCITFGWEACGSFWRAWRAAEVAGAALAEVIEGIAAQRDGPVDILCHSLGARVALSAMKLVPAGSIGRVVLLAGAEYRGNAQAALDSPAGRRAEVINVTSRENDPFDALIEWAIRPRVRGDRALGGGMGRCLRNWLDVQADCPRTREVLGDLGYRIPAPARRVCHWSAYLRPGLFRFYRDLIRDRDLLPLAALAGMLPETGTARWSRLLRLPRVFAGLTRVRSVS